jgi:hypothetical protein
MNKLFDFHDIHLHKYVSFEIHRIAEINDVLNSLHSLNIDCSIETDFKNRVIKFKICLDNCNDVQIKYLKNFLNLSECYEIKFFSG